MSKIMAEFIKDGGLMRGDDIEIGCDVALILCQCGFYHALPSKERRITKDRPQVITRLAGPTTTCVLA
jgi:hypothetical protein